MTFNNETEIYLKTEKNESGHIAIGAWWTTNFKGAEKISLYNSQPITLIVNFKVKIEHISYKTGSEWLRIALASAVQREEDRRHGRTTTGNDHGHRGCHDRRED